MSTQKELGTKAFTSKDFNKAIEHFTNAIQENPHDHTLLSNRSASYFNLNDFNKALEDAEKCIAIKPDWGKGYQRKAMALHSLGKYDEAIAAYELGIQYDPENAQLKQGLDKCKQDKEAGDDPMFGPGAMAKLMANPRIAGYFSDPQFRNMFELMKQNPQVMMQLVQTDPRFMDVFKELTGIDLMDMKEKQSKSKEQEEDMRKKQELERKQKEEEELKRKKEEEEAALPEEEKQKIQQKKQAETKKNEGNVAYKAKDFQTALQLYDAAIELDPTEITYLNNKAAVYFEQKDYDKCIEVCDKAIQKSKEGYYDYVKLGKALGRKANAKLQQGHYDEAIELFKESLLENNDSTVKEQYKRAEKMKKEDEAKKYLNPEIAEEHRQKGNDFYAQGDYPNAVKEYSEGLKRDPKSKNIYSNRAAAYIKLMEFADALKDIDKCLEIDPNFAKAYVRKGNCHHLMKEYHKALAAYEKGLKIDPENKDLQEGRMKTMQAVQMGAYGGGAHDEDRARHAMNDPEIQMILKDPRIVQVLKDLQENPQSAQGALRDPFIGDAINKLIAAGIVKMA